MLALLPEQEMVTLSPLDPDMEGGWVSTDWAQDPASRRYKERVVQRETTGQSRAPLFFPGPFPLTPHLVTCADRETWGGERNRGWWKSSLILPSLAPQLSRTSPNLCLFIIWQKEDLSMQMSPPAIWPFTDPGSVSSAWARVVGRGDCCVGVGVGEVKTLGPERGPGKCQVAGPSLLTP